MFNRDDFEYNVRLTIPRKAALWSDALWNHVGLAVVFVGNPAALTLRGPVSSQNIVKICAYNKVIRVVLRIFIYLSSHHKVQQDVLFLLCQFLGQ